MHKCPNCGQEIEKNFCPDCGTKWEDEKTCPICGAKVKGDTKYCESCGYPFYEPHYTPYKTEPTVQDDNRSPSKKLKIYSALKYVVVSLSLLFSIILFIIFVTPIAEIVWGMDFPNQSIGNVYEMYSGILSILPDIESALIALIVIATIFEEYSVISLILLLTAKTKRIRLFQRIFTPPELLGYGSTVFYITTFIIGIVILYMVQKADEGAGLLVAGACPILLIIFGALFCVLNIGVLIFHNNLYKNSDVQIYEEKQHHIQFMQQLRK